MFAAAGLLYLVALPGRLDPQGEVNRSCFSEALPSVPGVNGMLVSGHETYCDSFIHDSATYVYLHRAGAKDGSGNLILRYGDHYGAASRSPVIQWTDASTLSVSLGRVGLITKMVSVVDGVRIVYSVAGEDYPRSDWAAHVHDEKVIALSVSAFELALLALCWRLIVAIRRRRRALRPG
jgi:hypothetical protein